MKLFVNVFVGGAVMLSFEPKSSSLDSLDMKLWDCSFEEVEKAIDELCVFNPAGFYCYPPLMGDWGYEDSELAAKQFIDRFIELLERLGYRESKPAEKPSRLTVVYTNEHEDWARLSKVSFVPGLAAVSFSDVLERADRFENILENIFDADEANIDGVLKKAEEDFRHVF